MKRQHFATAAFLACISVLLAAPAAQSLEKPEQKCQGKLGKSAAKLGSTVVKEMGKCLLADISGKAVGTCPDAKASDKIAGAKQKISDATAKSCQSTCSVSGVICIADNLCPPLANGAEERCTAGPKNIVFDMTNLGFPGPYCEAELGASLTEASQIGECVGGLAEDTGNDLVDAVFGSITNASGISNNATSCLSAINKAASKLSATVFKGVVKCRALIAKGKSVGNPVTCTRDDAKLAAKIAKAESKVDSAIAAKCTDADVQELDLCNAGVGATLTTGDAATCIKKAATESADSLDLPAERMFITRSLVDVTYPSLQGTCGDGVVNQLPNPFQLLGEECDGDDDSACPGACLPAGDVFQCTCPNPKRIRFLADGINADLDNGWTGTSHNSGVTQNAGYFLELTNCDCDSMDVAECIGTSVDPICDTNGNQQPTCSHDPFGLSCDAHGSDADFRNEDEDCAICDEFATNAGASCASSNDCGSQCYDAGGTATGTCPGGQGDCAAGEICRGQCDRSQTCLIIPNGQPLPISAGGTAVCTITEFRTNINGTLNILTGEHETNIQQFSKVHLPVTNSVPCPTCGGFCAGGPLAGEICTGSCSVSGDDCRFDVDCPSGETCTTATDDCPESGICNLSLVCNGGTTTGEPCRFGAFTREFGTTSADCRPITNISGQGLQVNFLPQTSETVSMPAALPCTAPGYELFDCPCPDAGGRRTQPNLCAAACDLTGEGCGTGNTTIGSFTTCAGGTNANRACDEDADCPGSACSNNPTHCQGDPTTDGNLCSTSAECGTGSCVDACTGGRCVPLCIPDAGEPEEGICAAGPPSYHCSGDGNTFRACTATQAEGTCLATCSISAGACTSNADCPSGETCNGPCPLAQTCEAGNDGVLGTSDDTPGAGICVEDVRKCFEFPVSAEGGDLLNGEISSVNEVKSASVFCLGSVSNDAINNVSGLGGPGRLRQRGVYASNGFTTLP